MPSVVLVTVWIGPLPAYLPLFLGSCRANPSVSFLIVCDQPAPDGLPPNVRWVPMTLDGLNTRATARLGTPVRITTGYKVNDLKPLFGVVFADEIGADDFWGFCDVDLLWGNLRRFLTDAFLASGDLFSFRGPSWLSGSLTLFRTTSVASRLYERIPTWRAVLADPRYHGIDEAAFRYDEVERTVRDLVDGEQAVSLTDLAREAHASGDLRLVTPEFIAEPRASWAPYAYVWTDGTLVDATASQERMMLHFVHIKHEPFTHLVGTDPLPDVLYVTRIGTTTVPPEAHLSRWVEAARRAVADLPRAVRWYGGRIANKLVSLGR